MTKFKRIRVVFNSILSILSAILLMVLPEIGALVIFLLMCVVLAIKGIKGIIYYFSMARHMVDGETQLINGALFLILSFTMFNLARIPVHFIMIYLLVVYGFNGAISLLRAKEAKRLDSPGWQRSMIRGILNLGICLICMACFRSFNIMVYIFSITLIISALNRMISALKNADMVYIQ